MEDGKYLSAAQREYLVPKAFNAALRAGAAILEVYRRKGEFGIDLKRDLTPITEADRRAHAVIKEYLGPTHVPLLSEEGREMRFDERRDWDMFWLVDPLDGTKEFIKGNNEFTVNIALVVNNRPVVGIIYVPYYEKIYFCEKGHGSFMKHGVVADPEAEFSYEDVFAGAARLPLKSERNNPLRIAVSRSHKTGETEKYVAQMRTRFPDAVVVEQGSSYKFCMLAEGEIDYYPRTTNTYEWDTAAGEIILSDTGGTTKSLPELGKFAYNKESLLNPWFVCRSARFQD
jgi:3'(2'), 5'-bisphosphate nucleotidase